MFPILLASPGPYAIHSNHQLPYIRNLLVGRFFLTYKSNYAKCQEYKLIWEDDFVVLNQHFCGIKSALLTYPTWDDESCSKPDLQLEEPPFRLTAFRDPSSKVLRGWPSLKHWGKLHRQNCSVRQPQPPPQSHPGCPGALWPTRDKRGNCDFGMPERDRTRRMWC